MFPIDRYINIAFLVLQLGGIVADRWMDVPAWWFPVIMAFQLGYLLFLFVRFTRLERNLRRLQRQQLAEEIEFWAAYARLTLPREVLDERHDDECKTSNNMT